jgi:hypothetical protein
MEEEAMPVGVVSSRRTGAALLALVAMLCTACASVGGIVRTRENAVSGLITEEDLRIAVDTLVRNACPRMVGESAEAHGTVAVRVLQDLFDSEIKAHVTQSSGDQHVDETIADLVSQLAPRFRDHSQTMYTLRYNMAVRYNCARDAYGVTGGASVSL